MFRYQGCVARGILAFVLAMLLSKIIATIVFRLYFHPLSKYPGPVLAKITDLYSAYYSLAGRSHLNILRLHEKYGNHVRLGPNKISVCSLDAFQRIYNSKKVHKSEVYKCMLPAPGAFSTFTAIDESVHRRKRKVFSQAFSDSAMRAFEPTINREVGIFVRRLIDAPKEHDGVWSRACNMTEYSRHFATDVMGAFGFGYSFNTQGSEENRFLLKAIRGATLVTSAYCQYPKLQKYGLGRLVKLAGSVTREKFAKLSKQFIQRRLSEPSSGKRDLLYFYNHADLEEPFTLDELWAEARFTLIAGAETTATAISALFFYLSRYEGVCAKLTKTLRHDFLSPLDIKCGDKLKKCTYLWACIEETLRISPPVCTMLWRKVPAEGIHLDGEYIQPGVDVGVSIYVLHHNKAIFPEPQIFKPERWLESDTSPEQIKNNRDAMQAFSTGSRKCIGVSMAMTEIALCIAHTLWHMDMRRPDGSLGLRGGGGLPGHKDGRDKIDEFQLEEHLTSCHDGPYLHWKHRAAVDPAPDEL